MHIILNNRTEELNVDQATVQELITLKNFTFRLLVTKVNGTLVKKGERENVVVRDGDKVDVIHLISGG